MTSGAATLLRSATLFKERWRFKVREEELVPADAPSTRQIEWTPNSSQHRALLQPLGVNLEIHNAPLTAALG